MSAVASKVEVLRLFSTLLQASLNVSLGAITCVVVDHIRRITFLLRAALHLLVGVPVVGVYAYPSPHHRTLPGGAVEHGNSSTHLEAPSPARPHFFAHRRSARHATPHQSSAGQTFSVRHLPFETWLHTAGICYLHVVDEFSADNRLLSGT